MNNRQSDFFFFVNSKKPSRLEQRLGLHLDFLTFKENALQQYIFYLYFFRENYSLLKEEKRNYVNGRNSEGKFF